MAVLRAATVVAACLLPGGFLAVMVHGSRTLPGVDPVRPAAAADMDGVLRVSPEHYAGAAPVHARRSGLPVPNYPLRPQYARQVAGAAVEEPLVDEVLPASTILRSPSCVPRAVAHTGLGDA